MGLLDDAIREHLELKRRRGTDPGELERLELEALGPVRRTQADPFDAPLADEPDADGSSFAEEEFAEAWPPDRAASSFTDRDAERLGVGEDEEWPRPEHAALEGGTPVEPDTAAPVAPAPLEPAERSPAGELPNEEHLLEQETVEHDLEAELAEEDSRDDMLEETPEFLQDTPDHDRLWFEQRPPRDFDLDG